MDCGERLKENELEEEFSSERSGCIPLRQRREEKGL
jgi:hypothetical protein